MTVTTTRWMLLLAAAASAVSCDLSPGKPADRSSAPDIGFDCPAREAFTSPPGRYTYVFVGGHHFSGTSLIETVLSQQPWAAGLDVSNTCVKDNTSCRMISKKAKHKMMGSIGCHVCMAPENEGVFVTKVFQKNFNLSDAMSPLKYQQLRFLKDLHADTHHHQHHPQLVSIPSTANRKSPAPLSPPPPPPPPPLSPPERWRSDNVEVQGEQRKMEAAMRSTSSLSERLSSHQRMHDHNGYASGFAGPATSIVNEKTTNGQDRYRNMTRVTELLPPPPPPPRVVVPQQDFLRVAQMAFRGESHLTEESDVDWEGVGRLLAYDWGLFWWCGLTVYEVNAACQKELNDKARCKNNKNNKNKNVPGKLLGPPPQQIPIERTGLLQEMGKKEEKTEEEKDRSRKKITNVPVTDSEAGELKLKLKEEQEEQDSAPLEERRFKFRWKFPFFFQIEKRKKEAENTVENAAKGRRKRRMTTKEEYHSNASHRDENVPHIRYRKITGKPKVEPGFDGNGYRNLGTIDGSERKNDTTTHMIEKDIENYYRMRFLQRLFSPFGPTAHIVVMKHPFSMCKTGLRTRVCSDGLDVLVEEWLSSYELAVSDVTHLSRYVVYHHEHLLTKQQGPKILKLIGDVIESPEALVYDLSDNSPDNGYRWQDDNDGLNDDKLKLQLKLKLDSAGVVDDKAGHTDNHNNGWEMDQRSGSSGGGDDRGRKAGDHHHHDHEQPRQGEKEQRQRQIAKLQQQRQKLKRLQQQEQSQPKRRRRRRRRRLNLRNYKRIKYKRGKEEGLTDFITLMLSPDEAQWRVRYRKLVRPGPAEPGLLAGELPGGTKMLAQLPAELRALFTDPRREEWERRLNRFCYSLWQLEPMLIPDNPGCTDDSIAFMHSFSSSGGGDYVDGEGGEGDKG